MTPTRRRLLAGIGAAAVLPRAAGAAIRDDAAIALALDEAAALPVDRALARLDRLLKAEASPGATLDLAAARAGLKIDFALTHASGADRFSLQVQRVAGDDARLEIVARDLDAARLALANRATKLFEALGIPGTALGTRFEALWRDPRYLYADDDHGRAVAVADMRATLAAIRARLPALFDPLPTACLDVDVRTLSAAEIAAGKGGYRVLPAPGVRGTYIVDLTAIRRRPRCSLPSVVAHELLPGHMIQMPLEARAAPHPLRLRYAAAFSEGWGIYAEMLMAQDGLFATPADQLGHIHWMLFRICRGLADIALNAQEASEEKVLADLLEWQGEPAYFAPFAADVARIAKEPGIRAAEAWVPLRLVQRRPHARLRWPAYHRKLLDHGRRRTEQIAV